MTAKEKFYSEIERVGAKRVEWIEDADVYAGVDGATVFIFCHSECEYWDMYDCGRYDDILMVPQVLSSAFCGKEHMPDDMSVKLGEFYAWFPVKAEDLKDAIVWLWNNTNAFDNIWGKHHTLHVEYEDDEENPMTAEEWQEHENYMGRMLMVQRMLLRDWGCRFNKDTLERMHQGKEDILGVRDSLRQTAGALLSDKIMAERWSTCNPEEFWKGQGVYSLSFKRRLEACYWIMDSIRAEMDAVMDQNDDAYSDQTVEWSMYQFVKKSCKEIEELRTMDNPDI